MSNHGGLWAVECKKDKQFIGFVGLHKPKYDLPVINCVEIGWRLEVMLGAKVMLLKLPIGYWPLHLIN